MKCLKTRQGLKLVLVWGQQRAMIQLDVVQGCVVVCFWELDFGKGVISS